MSYKSNYKIFNQVTYTEEKNEEDARIHNYLNKIRNNIHTNKIIIGDFFDSSVFLKCPDLN